ncbi:MAG: AraC family transcriptional regulator ligand-binding domain-containing protein [Hahellaceae bacterium]|nr:AraC family transcriptional regulator ligand-binding domain-containing protein [Hahellaceae bacterium]
MEGDRQTLFPGAEIYLIHRHMASEGIEPVQWLAGTGLSPQDLRGTDLRVSLRQFDCLYRNVFRLSHQPAAGYRLGLALNLSRWGVVAGALVCAKTLGHALTVASQYRTLLRSRFTLVPEAQGAWIRLRISRRPGMDFPVSEAFALEMLVGTLQRQISDLIAQPFAFSRIEMTYPPPAYARFLSEVSRSHWHFSANEAALLIPAQLMAQRLPLANPVAQRQIVMIAQRELEQVQRIQKEDIVWRVAQCLADAEGDLPEMAEVAARLHVSERTLRRQLAEQGESFRHLLRVHQIDRARTALANPGMTLADVVRLAGFRDEGRFRACFRELTGLSPIEFRRQFISAEHRSQGLA